jgi:hypothetical protein
VIPTLRPKNTRRYACTYLYLEVKICKVGCEFAWGGGCGLDSTVSGQGPAAGCCECGDEPSGSCATELVS